MSKHRWFLAVITILALSGCAESHGVGEACGSATCAPGLVCCNASCGICTEPGAGCPAIACVDAGGPLCGADVCGPGELCCPTCPGQPDSCSAGPTCPVHPCPLPPPGCESCGSGELCCEGCGAGERFCAPGPVCPPIDCPPPPGCADDVPCPPGFYCAYPGACGGTGTCQPAPDGCTDDCPGVCGCDGRDYCNACSAQQNGSDVAHDGSCGSPPTCAGLDYCDCAASSACEPLIDLTPGCVCPCDDPFNCTGELCECDCGGAQYRGCGPAGRCAETQLRCEPGWSAQIAADGCLDCLCPGG